MILRKPGFYWPPQRGLENIRFGAGGFWLLGKVDRSWLVGAQLCDNCLGMKAQIDGATATAFEGCRKIVRIPFLQKHAVQSAGGNLTQEGSKVKTTLFGGDYSEGGIWAL